MWQNFWPQFCHIWGALAPRPSEKCFFSTFSGLCGHDLGTKGGRTWQKSQPHFCHTRRRRPLTAQERVQSVPKLSFFRPMGWTPFLWSGRDPDYIQGGVDRVPKKGRVPVSGTYITTLMDFQDSWQRVPMLAFFFGSTQASTRTKLLNGPPITILSNLEQNCADFEQNCAAFEQI